MSAGEEQSRSLIADRLDYLFKHCTAPDGKPYTAAGIARRAQKLGYNLTTAYISHLRTGRVVNPSFRAVEGLAAAFDIDIRYFGDEKPPGSNPEDELVSGTPTDSHIRVAAFRMAGLEESELDVVDDLVRSFRRRRGLPDDPTA